METVAPVVLLRLEKVRGSRLTSEARLLRGTVRVLAALETVGLRGVGAAATLPESVTVSVVTPVLERLTLPETDPPEAPAVIRT